MLKKIINKIKDAYHILMLFIEEMSIIEFISFLIAFIIGSLFLAVVFVTLFAFKSIRKMFMIVFMLLLLQCSVENRAIKHINKAITLTDGEFVDSYIHKKYMPLKLDTIRFRDTIYIEKKVGYGDTIYRDTLVIDDKNLYIKIRKYYDSLLNQNRVVYYYEIKKDTIVRYKEIVKPVQVIKEIVKEENKNKGFPKILNWILFGVIIVLISIIVTLRIFKI